jgi:hypothetical protein
MQSTAHVIHVLEWQEQRFCFKKRIKERQGSPVTTLVCIVTQENNQLPFILFCLKLVLLVYSSPSSSRSFLFFVLISSSLKVADRKIYIYIYICSFFLNNNLDVDKEKSVNKTQPSNLLGPTSNKSISQLYWVYIKPTTQQIYN